MELRYPCKANGMYVISKNQMDDIATMILEEYMPSVLENPQPVNIENLAEDGMFLTIKNRFITEDNSILGMTAFDDVKGIPCLDDKFHPIEIDLDAGTVVIHSWLLSQGNTARRRYTIAHETSHWILHRTYHSPTNRKFQFRTQKSPYIACRSESIGQAKHKLNTDHDWEEWQADSLAAAILMPLRPFFTFVGELLSNHGKQYFVENERAECFEVIGKVANQFMVSKQAAQIRMKQLGYIREYLHQPLFA